MATTPLPSIVASSRGLLQEEGGLPGVRISTGFDPNEYKMIKSLVTTSANHHFWEMSLKQGLMGLMTPKK